MFFRLLGTESLSQSNKLINLKLNIKLFNSKSVIPDEKSDIIMKERDFD